MRWASSWWGVPAQVARRLDLWPLVVDPSIRPQAARGSSQKEATPRVVVAFGQLGEVAAEDVGANALVDPLPPAVASSSLVQVVFDPIKDRRTELGKIGLSLPSERPSAAKVVNPDIWLTRNPANAAKVENGSTNWPSHTSKTIVT